MGVYPHHPRVLNQVECACVVSGCPFSYVSEGESERDIMTHTWREIGGMGVDKVEPKVQRLDHDFREEPFSGSGMPRFGYQGTLFERCEVVF